MRRGLTIAVTIAALATWWPAMAGAATGWVLQPTPAPPASALYGVSCPSATSCTAVGNYTSSAGTELPLAEHWDGSTWTIQATPAPPGTPVSRLDAVSCATATDCTAVGNYESSSPDQFSLLAEHWDGSTWTIQATPNPAGTYFSTPSGISCATAADCVVVGNADSTKGPIVTLAEHWNGSTWALTAAHDVPGSVSSALTAVSCTAVTRCVAIGDSYPRSADGTLTDVWNGSAWTLTRSDTAQEGTFYAISCTGADSCTAVGGASAGTLAASWNGSTWAQQAMPRTARLDAASLVGVSCTPAAGCTAVGAYQLADLQPASLAEQYSGGRWQVQATARPAAARILEAVSCTAAGCTAAGFHYSGTTGQAGTLAERD